MLKKGKVVGLTAIAVVILSACATPPEPAPDPDPIKVNAVYKERCYSKDTVEREVAGRVFLEEGEQFYFQPECNNYLAPHDYVEKTKPENMEPVVTPVPRGFVVNPVKSAPTAKEPTCYFDKETAGRGDLPPCPWDEEKQEYIKDI